ncbi:uncharacterized protein LOC127755686 [Oryza glaberrima]|uniref:uncharacterized protein LOC127755686 n=1 Tax=Oryza glaberrima TaxID=4538 RepID=UPI00224BF30D|nr:uncharacterized protein LOC127755686 [Oryza glaberrima]
MAMPCPPVSSTASDQIVLSSPLCWSSLVHSIGHRFKIWRQVVAATRPSPLQDNPEILRFTLLNCHFQHLRACHFHISQTISDNLIRRFRRVTSHIPRRIVTTLSSKERIPVMSYVSCVVIALPRAARAMSDLLQLGSCSVGLP